MGIIDGFLIVLFWIIAGLFYTIHEHIKFNYSGSVFERWDRGLKKAWFKNNARPDLQKRFRFLPFLWDGYHSAAWIMKVFYYFLFCVPARYVPGVELWQLILTGLVFGYYELVSSFVFYQVFFKGKK